MSHRSRYEVEREGERAFESGASSIRNPYDRYGDYEERREREAWDDGYRHARVRQENEEQERQERMQAARRTEERRQEQAWLEEQERLSYEGQQEKEPAHDDQK